VIRNDKFDRDQGKVFVTRCPNHGTKRGFEVDESEFKEKFDSRGENGEGLSERRW